MGVRVTQREREETLIEQVAAFVEACCVCRSFRISGWHAVDCPGRGADLIRSFQPPHEHSWRVEGDGNYEEFRNVCEDCGTELL